MTDEALPLTLEDYRELAIFLEEKLSECTTPADAAALRRRLASLYFTALDDSPRAALHTEELLRPMETLILKDPDDDDLRRQYVEAATAAGAELRAAEVLARALKRTKANDVRERVGFEVATLYFQQGEIKQARSAFLDVVLVDAGGPCGVPAARRLLDFEGEPSDPKVIGAALEMIAKGASAPSERQAAGMRLLEMHQAKPLKETRLAVMYRALVESPRADEALAWLCTYYERKGDHSALSGVYRRRALRAGDPAVARPLALRSLELFPFDSDAQRIEQWMEFIEKFGPHHQAHTQLIPLLEGSSRWDDLCRVLEADVDLATTGERPVVLARLGLARAVRGDSAGALAALRDCLSLDASNDLARDALEKLMASGDQRLAAADVLEPMYREAQNQEGMVRILETRGELLAEPSARLAALSSAADIAMDPLGDRERSMNLCGRALGVALGSATDRVLDWIVRIERVAGNQSERLAAILLDVLGERPIDSFERVAVAVSAMEALVAVGGADRALALCRRALEADPSSPELLRRFDDLAQSSETPEERLARYTAALAATTVPARRSSLMHVIAAIKSGPLGDLVGAVDVWRDILFEDPNDSSVYDVLIDATTKLGDGDAALEFIDRARASLRGPKRNLMTLRQATALAQRGEGDRALGLCREIVDTAALPTSALESIAEIARDEDDRALYRQALERIVDGDDPEARKSALERLGDFVFESLGDRRAAVDSWKAAAQLYGDEPAEQEHARALYERVLETWSDDGQAAHALAELNVRSGDWSKIPDALRTLIRAEEDVGRCVELLLRLEQSAVRARALEEFVSLADELFGRLGRQPSEQIRALTRARTRALVADPDRQAEASHAYRQLIESFENREDVADFEAFVESRPGADERHQDRRWLYQWRSTHDEHPAAILVEWANAEEEYGEPAAAITVYERLRATELRPVALEALCRLRFHAGDFVGGLAAYAAMREGLADDERLALDLNTARALFDEMGRPIEAATVLAPALAARPAVPAAHDLARTMLEEAVLGSEIAARFEDAASRLDDLGAFSIFEFLIANGTGGAGAAGAATSAPRQRWLNRIVDLSPADPAAALTLSLGAAVDVIDDVSLWQGAERAARGSGKPHVVAEAYRRLILGGVTDPALADMLGRRMVALEEECAIKSPQSIDAMLRVLALAPGARWALDRVKLVLGSQGRYGELLDLFDRAIDAAPDEKQRENLLHEAASTARDLAGAPPRAIAYLESLRALRSDDPTVDGALERLYEREGRKVDLIELLRGRTERETGFKRRDLRRRVASLCLDIGDVERAGASVEHLLSEDASVADVVDLLERILEVPAPPPQSGARRGMQPAADMQKRAIELLRGHYESIDRIAEMVRIAEKSLARATEADRLAEGIRDLVRLRLRAEDGSRGSFVRAMARVESDAAGDPRLTKIAYRAVLHRAIRAMKGAPSSARADAENGALAAVQKLVTVAIDAQKVEVAVRLLHRASRLPFERSRRRDLLRAAASMSWEKLQDRARAIGLLRELFDEDAADEAAAQSLDLYAELLDAAGQHDKLAKLWEGQAEIRAQASKPAEEQACWERAAELWERQGAWKEPLRAYRKAAALGSDASFEALARIHADRREWAEVAKALESLDARSPAKTGGLRALRLAEAYAELDQRDRARNCLEEALKIPAGETEDTLIRDRLAALYRQDEIWAPLARLLSEDARRTVEPERKRHLLREAADVSRSKLGEPVKAAALLEQALSLDPRDNPLRTTLVDLLESLQRWEEVVAVLREQVALYGDHRSKERSLVHHRLARALVRKDRRDEALAELRVAVDMQPSDASILHDVGRVAFDVGELDLAEEAYRSLLLAHRPDQEMGAALLPRAQIFALLSEIAFRKGDAARAADLVDSAVDEAVEHREDPRPFEHGLRARGRYELLSRALERRVARGATLTVRATALGELVGLWKEHLGRAPELGTRLRQHGEQIARDLEREELADASAWGAVAMVHAAFGDAGGVSMSGPIADRAISELSKAVAADPTASEAIHLLASLLDHQGRVADALPLYESVLDRQPTDAATARALAVRLEALGSKRVAEALELWIAVDATAGGAVAKRLVDLRREEGDQARLVRALDAAVRSNPRDADLLSQRATEREHAGDQAGAVSDLEGAIAVDPARVDRLIDLLTRTSGSSESLLTEERVAHVADALARLDRPEHGKRDLERLLAFDPKRWERLANLFATRADHEDDRDKKAELQLRAAHLFLEEAKDPLGTLRVIAPLRKTKPDSIEALLLWARAQVAAGRAEQAVPALHEAVKSHRGKRSPLLASICLEIGRAHLALDEVVEAFDALESAFNADWRTRDVALLLGLVALDLGEEKAADRAFLAVTTLPTAPSALSLPLGKEASGPGVEAATKALAFYHLASMAVSKGDLSKARRLVNRALDGDPGHAPSRALLAKISPRRAESAQ